MARLSDRQFELIVTQHLKVLYRVAYRLTGNVADAEDLVQDTCLKAHLWKRELERYEHPRAWMLRVQYRLFLDQSRHQKRSPIYAMDETVESSLLMTSPTPGLEEQADAAALAQRLQRGWTQLEPGQQALLALHAEGYRLSELQEITGIPKNALKARLQRGRARLTKLLNTYTLPIAAASGERE